MVVVDGIENKKPERVLFFSKASPLAGLGMMEKTEMAKHPRQESHQQLSWSLYMVNSQDNLTNI